MESKIPQSSSENIEIENAQNTNIQPGNSAPRGKKQRASRKEKIERKQRNKEEKKKNPTQQAQEINVDPFFRQMIPIADDLLSPEFGDRKSITIMTYNILAQSLCRRELFPKSGESLKWKYRRPRLIKEILHYEPDVACFQEMDGFHYNDTFKPEFERAGYELLYFKSDKKLNGCCIIWKHSKFTKLKELIIEFDKLEVPTMPTNCVGLIVSLRFNKMSHQNIVDECDADLGIVIGTAHLYWRPQCVYERTRQSLLLYESLIKFNEEFGFATFLAGDFNSPPGGPTYKLMIRGKHSLTERDTAELKDSMRSFGEENSVENASSSSTSNTCRESDITPLAKDDDDLSSPVTEASLLNSPTDQQSETSIPSMEKLSSCEPTLPDLFSRFSNLPPCTSLYSKYYHLKDPDNTFQTEPKFTSYGIYFRGTVDYIFYIHNSLQSDAGIGDKIKNGDDCKQTSHNVGECVSKSSIDNNNDPLKITEKVKKIKNRELEVSKILRMPTEEEIEFHLPNHKLSSDHICLVVEIEGLC